MLYLGNRTEDSIIDFMWSSNGADGASITRSTNGTISVYKGNSTTQTTTGVTDTEDFDSLTGIHHCRIDTSADAFYEVGYDYMVVLSAATIDSKTVNAVLAVFSIEKGFAEVDVTKWTGTTVAAPDTAGYPKVTIKDGTGTGEIDTASGKVLLQDGSITAAVITTGAIDADAIADNAIDAGAIATGAITAAKFAAGAIDADAIGADAITAAKIAADAVTEIQSGLATAAALATVDGLIDTIVAKLPTGFIMGSSSTLSLDGTIQNTQTYAQATWVKLPTQYIMGSSTPADMNDEIDAILADTNELQTDWVNGGRLDLLIDAILEDTGTTLPAQIAALMGGTIVTGSVNDAAPTTYSFITNLVSAVDNFYRYWLIKFTSGTLNGQWRAVKSYNGTTFTISVGEDYEYAAAPANADTFSLYNFYTTPFDPDTDKIAGTMTWRESLYEIWFKLRNRITARRE